MILAKIRAETIACHKTLERRLDLFNRVTSLKSYIALLQKWHSYLQPLENFLQTNEALSELRLKYSLRERLKSHLITQDLNFFDAALPAPVAPALHPLIPSLKTVENYVGVAYVLEGSTLGGQIISKEIKKRLELKDERGTLFFSGYGPLTGTRWKDFCTSLEEWGAKNTVNHERIVTTAVATFKTLETWLCGEDAKHEQKLG